jgi:Rrf2 family protein
MRFLSQEEYGLRCLLQVARHQQNGLVTMAEVAEAEGLSAEYAGRLLQELRRGGLVKSEKGPGGGYKLGRPAAEISLWQAIEVLGGPLFPDDFCACHPGQRRTCIHVTECAVREVWREANERLRDFLQGIALADVMRASRVPIGPPRDHRSPSAAAARPKGP